MPITIELPGLEEVLRQRYPDLEAATREALLIDAYRSGRLSLGRLAEVLGTSSAGANQWLDQHGVGPSYDFDAFEQDKAR
ncbi:MAG: UPF0175 family protein [Planctomycetota bacterium]